MSAISEQMNQKIENATIRWKRGIFSTDDLAKAIEEAQLYALARYEREMGNDELKDATEHPLWDEYEDLLYRVAEQYADELGIA